MTMPPALLHLEFGQEVLQLLHLSAARRGESDMARVPKITFQDHRHA
jgi:hypothetical protein